MIQYIYLVHVREFLNASLPIYKIGMSTKENYMRFNQYPKGSHLLFQMKCIDCVTMERQLIALFSEKFTCRKDIGSEYFEGNCDEMIDYIYNAIKTETSATNVADAVVPMVIETPDKFASVVITDKKKFSGYCREPNKAWRLLSAEDIDDNIRRKADVLFCKKPDFYNLAYNEFIVRNDTETADYLFNTQTFTLHPIETTDIATRITLLNDPIKQTVHSNIQLDAIAVSTVKHLCSYFMTDEIKSLFKTVFVCPKKSIMFNDRHDVLFHKHTVTDVVINILDVLLAPNKWINASLFYSNPEEFKKCVKVNKPRVCIIEETDMRQTEFGISTFEILRQLEKYGFVAFIVKCYPWGTGCNKFLEDKYRRLYNQAIQYAAIEFNRHPDDPLFEDIVQLLSSPKYYMFQFLKLCFE